MFAVYDEFQSIAYRFADFYHTDINSSMSVRTFSWQYAITRSHGSVRVLSVMFTTSNFA